MPSTQKIRTELHTLLSPAFNYFVYQYLQGGRSPATSCFSCHLYELPLEEDTSSGRCVYTKMPNCLNQNVGMFRSIRHRIFFFAAAYYFFTFLYLYFLFQKLFYSFVSLITMEDGLEFNTMERTI